MPAADHRTILVVYAHPDPRASRVNTVLLQHAARVPGVIVSDLYEKYPDFYIDARAEQRLLLRSDLIVLQHPIYWYSCPALLKQWQETVLTQGFAYGQGGDALHGKDCLLAVTAGAAFTDYTPAGLHGRPLPELLNHALQWILFCGMRALTPLIFYGAQKTNPDEAQAHARTYADFLQGYTQGRIDPTRDAAVKHV